MLPDCIPIDKRFPFGFAPIITPIFDAHIGSAEFREREFRECIKQILDDEHWFVVIGGDMMDYGLKNSVTNIYEQTMRPAEQKRYCAEILKPLADAGRILCGTSGNHEYRGVKEADDNPLYDVFVRLNIENVYRENICYLILRIGTEAKSSKPGKTRPTYCGIITHGSGGGMYIGSGANKVERFGRVFDGVDFIVTGHTHKPTNFPVAKTVVDIINSKVTERQFTAVVATSWLKWGGYPVRGMMAPAAFAPQKMFFMPNKKLIQVLQ